MNSEELTTDEVDDLLEPEGKEVRTTCIRCGKSITDTLSRGKEWFKIHECVDDD